jgi:hypothetical protein
MAGFGALPKPRGTRAGHRKDPEYRVIHMEPVSQPDLPTFMVERDGQLTEFAWPAVTREWWAMWNQSPLNEDLTEADWDFLAQTAVLHARFWDGDMRVAAELRIRQDAYGVTPAARAKLRIVFAQADKAEDGDVPPVSATYKHRPLAS